MRDDGTLSSREVAELARVTYRQLDHWVGTGLLPIQDRSPGSGSRRRWHPDDVMRARVFAELVHAGVTPSAVSEALPTGLVGGERFALLLNPNVWLAGRLS